MTPFITLCLHIIYTCGGYLALKKLNEPIDKARRNAEYKKDNIIDRNTYKKDM